METRKTENDYKPEDVITLPTGLIGLTNLKKWILVENDAGLPIMFLKSLDSEGFQIPVSSSDLFVSEYNPVVPDTAQDMFNSSDDVVTLIVTTIPTRDGIITGNLAAPLFISAENKVGIQVIQEDYQLSLKQPLDIQLIKERVCQENENKKVADSEYSDKNDEAVVCV